MSTAPNAESLGRVGAPSQFSDSTTPCIKAAWAPAELPLGDALEPGPLQVIGFDAPLRGGPVGQEPLEHAPRHPHHATVFADLDAETPPPAARHSSGRLRGRSVPGNRAIGARATLGFAVDLAKAPYRWARHAICASPRRHSSRRRGRLFAPNGCG